MSRFGKIYRTRVFIDEPTWCLAEGGGGGGEYWGRHGRQNPMSIEIKELFSAPEKVKFLSQWKETE